MRYPVRITNRLSYNRIPVHGKPYYPKYLSGILYLVLSLPLEAAVVLDGSAGPGGTLAGPDYAVSAELGALHDSNLFHSFSEFSLQTGESAVFSGPGSIARVIGRVTGGAQSFIDGTLRNTIPGADLFLLNPHGWLFGPSADLDVQGALYLSSADALHFTDGAEFSAHLGSASSFTSAAPEAFGFVGTQVAEIRMDGTFPRALPDDLMLSAGDITLNRTTLNTSGNIALHASHMGGTVPLRGQAGSTAADGGIHMQDSFLTSLGKSSGDIFIRSGRFVQDFSLVQSLASPGNSGGIEIHATQHIEISGELSQILSWSGPGDSGAVRLNAPQVEIRGQVPFVGSAVSGPGTGGALAVEAGRLHLTQNSVLGTDGGLEGHAGAVRVQAGTVAIDNGAQLASLAGGEARSGDIRVRAAQIHVDDALVTSAAAGDSGRLDIAATQSLSIGNQGLVSTDTVDGQAGAVTVNAGNVSLRGGAALQSNADDAGRAGDLTLAADSLLHMENAGISTAGGRADVSLRAAAMDLNNGTNIAAAGDLYVEADGLTATGANLSARDSAYLTLFGRADLITSNLTTGQNIDLSARDVQIQGGTVNAADTAGLTAADRLALSAAGVAGKRVEIDGEGDVSLTATVLDADTAKVRAGATLLIRDQEPLGVGEALTLSAAELELDNLDTITRTIRLDAGSTLTLNDSVLLATGEGAELHADRIRLREGAQVVTQEGGALTVNAGTALELDGGAQLVSETSGAGAAGPVTVAAGQLELCDGAQLGSETSGAGAAGPVTVTARQLELAGGARIRSQTGGSGDGGSVHIDAAERLRIEEADFSRPRTGITTTTTQQGAGGNIRITTPDLEITGNSVIAAETRSSGTAGNLHVSVDTLWMSGGASLSTKTDGGGVGGELQVHAADAVGVEGFGADNLSTRIVSESLAAGRGGVIALDTPHLRVDGGLLQAAATGTGDAGAISVQGGTVEFVNGGRANNSTTGAGRAGNLEIRADTLTLSGSSAARGHLEKTPSGLSSSTFGAGDGGVVDVAATELVLDQQATLQTLTRGDGDAGAIRVAADNIEILNGADIDASNEGSGQGTGGDISIQARGTLRIGAEPSEQENFP